MALVKHLWLVFFSLLATCSLGIFIPDTPAVDAIFDYVVVGGGTSGLAIASRLAEDSSLNVAVVEEGGYYELEGNFMSVIPGFAAAANTGTSPGDMSPIDWNFITLPLKVCSRHHYLFVL